MGTEIDGEAGTPEPGETGTRQRPSSLRPADQPTFTLGYRPSFDSLRGIGMIIVLITHSFWVWPSVGSRLARGGFQGVDIFFILSGLLITSLLLEERKRNGRVSFKAFYERRAFRLLPSLFFVLACHFVYAAVTGRSLSAEFEAFAFILGYVANLASAYGRPDILLYSFDQTWSLAVEEQYYLFFFPLLVFGLGFIRRFRTVFIVLLIALVLAFAWRFYLTLVMPMTPRNMHILYVRTDTRLDALLVGPAAAFLMQLGLRSSRTLSVIALAATAYVATFLYWGDLDAPWLYRWAFTPLELSWGVIVLWLLVNADTLVHRFLRIRPLVWLGRTSYEVYLWHLPVYVAFAEAGHQGPLWLVAAVAMSIGAAAFSYHVVSVPFLRIKRRRALALRGSARGV